MTLSNLTDWLFLGRRASLAPPSIASVFTSATKVGWLYLIISILYMFYLGGGPVSAASKDFFMASMAASCKLFARHCSHHSHYFLAVYDSHQHPHLVNLFYCLGPRFFSSRHPVGRAKLQHILFNCLILKLQTLNLCISCSVVTLKCLNSCSSEGNDNNLHEEAYPGRRNFFPDQFPDKFKVMHL